MLVHVSACVCICRPEHETWCVYECVCIYAKLLASTPAPVLELTANTWPLASPNSARAFSRTALASSWREQCVRACVCLRKARQEFCLRVHTVMRLFTMAQEVRRRSRNARSHLSFNEIRVCANL